MPQLWLPVALPGLLQTSGPMGNDMTIGSVDGLVAELEQVNDRTLRLDPAALEAAQKSGPPEDGAFEPLARFGLAVFLSLARVANERSQPMILDW